MQPLARELVLGSLLLACGGPAPRPTGRAADGALAPVGAACGLGDPRTTAVCAPGLACCGGPTSPNITEENGYAGWCARACPEIPPTAGSSRLESSGSGPLG